MQPTEKPTTTVTVWYQNPRWMWVYSYDVGQRNRMGRYFPTRETALAAGIQDARDDGFEVAA